MSASKKGLMSRHVLLRKSFDAHKPLTQWLKRGGEENGQSLSRRQSAESSAESRDPCLQSVHV